MAIIDKSRPLDPDKKCEFYVSIEQPACNQPATHVALVIKDKVKTSVFLCQPHMTSYEKGLARSRAERNRRAAQRRVLEKK